MINSAIRFSGVYYGKGTLQELTGKLEALGKSGKIYIAAVDENADHPEQSRAFALGGEDFFRFWETQYNLQINREPHDVLDTSPKMRQLYELKTQQQLLMQGYQSAQEVFLNKMENYTQQCLANGGIDAEGQPVQML